MVDSGYNKSEKMCLELEDEILELVKRFMASKDKNQSLILGKDQIPYSKAIFGHEEIQAIISVVLAGWWGAANKVEAFEEELAKYHNLKHAVMTNSGSSANLLAISTLCSRQMGNERLKTGDEVITPATTFPTTFNPIIQNHLTPVLIDTDVQTLNMACEDLQKAISSKTRAIFVPHTLGNPNNMTIIGDLVEDHNLFLIEDCCDALGSTYKNMKVGTFGDIATFSFYPAHHITTGEGGALITNNTNIKKISKSLRDWGRDCWCSTNEENPLGACKNRFNHKISDIPYDHKYIYSNIGYNVKPLELQGAMGLVQLRRLPKFIDLRKKNFIYLKDQLTSIDGKFIHIIKATDNSDPSWFAFPFILKNNNPKQTLEFINFLEANFITTRRIFAGNIIRHPAYSELSKEIRIMSKLTHADQILKSGVFVGIYPGLSTTELDYIASKIKEFFLVTSN